MTIPKTLAVLFRPDRQPLYLSIVGELRAPEEVAAQMLAPHKPVPLVGFEWIEWPNMGLFECKAFRCAEAVPGDDSWPLNAAAVEALIESVSVSPPPDPGATRMPYGPVIVVLDNETPHPLDGLMTLQAVRTIPEPA
jgi:hypothetical protein